MGLASLTHPTRVNLYAGWTPQYIDVMAQTIAMAIPDIDPVAGLAARTQ